jgi:hypothetical protein
MNDTRILHDIGRTAPGGLQLEVVGYDVLASDGTIGKVDDNSFTAGAGYLVVKTGWWIFGKKHVVPTSLVTYIDDKQRKVFVHGTKAELRATSTYKAHRRSQLNWWHQPDVGPGKGSS